MRWWINRPVFGVLYVLVGALGVTLTGFDAPGQDGPVTLFLGVLLTLLAAAGLVMVGFLALSPRSRRGPIAGTAPSGQPATVFRRSPFLTVWSVVLQLALAGWLAAVAVTTYRAGHPGWAVLPAGCALAMLWPSVAVLRGKVAVGGLWLTAAGLEYRREAISWTLAWSDLSGVQNLQTTGAVLPYEVRRGQTAAVRPVLLTLDHGTSVQVRRTLPRLWDRECGAPFGTVCLDCVDLAGGPTLIAETVERYRLFPELRTQLGRAPSPPRGPR